jgi:F-type H+-transporting ATPase subunit alpha
MIEILKQDQYSAMRVGHQILIIFAGTNGYIDDIPVPSIRKFEAELLKFLDLQHPELADEIEQKKSIDDTLKDKIKAAIEGFKKTFVA